MATTKQGAFPTTYHHIDAPTHQDKKYWDEKHKRKLIVPRFLAPDEEYLDEVYTHPLVALLAQTSWNIRRKLDGENIRIYWDGEQALWNGKIDKFTCSAEFTDYMNSTFVEEIFEKKFGHEKEVYIFGEKMGPKTQGNELGLDSEQVIIYDVRCNGTWVSPEAVKEIANYFGVKTCYDFMSEIGAGRHSWLLPHIIQAVAEGEFKTWEGIVATPLIECQDQQGHRVIVKVKNKDYYREELEKGE